MPTFELGPRPRERVEVYAVPRVSAIIMLGAELSDIDTTNVEETLLVKHPPHALFADVTIGAPDYLEYLFDMARNELFPKELARLEAAARQDRWLDDDAIVTTKSGLVTPLLKIDRSI